MECANVIEDKTYFKSVDLTWKLLPETLATHTSSNEKLLMIMNRNSGLSPYSHSFIEEDQDPQVLSGFVSAMTSFMGELNGEKDSNWKTVYGSDSILLVEGGDWIIGALVASRETNEARSKLRTIIREFEDSFAVLKDADGIDASMFRDFDEYVRRVFVDEQITSRTKVTKMYHWRPSLSRFSLPSTAFKVSKILLGFEETESIENIARFQRLPIKEVIEIISKAYWQGIVKLQYIPSDDDILALAEKAASIIFQKTNPLALSSTTISVISLLDGQTSLSNLTNDMIIQDQELLLAEFGLLINNGFIQRISVEKRLVLLNQCVLSNLVFRGSSKIGKREMKSIFQTIRNQGRIYHPRISRIILTDDIHIRCILEESMTPVDLDDMCDALEYFIREIMEHLTSSCGNHIADSLIQSARRESNQIWAPYLENVVI